MPRAIRGNNITHRLLLGVYYGDIILLGNDVTVVGTRRRGSCDERDRTILEGDLIIRGNNARVYDVGTRGRVTVTGNNADIDSPCDGDRRRDDDDDDRD